jgi:hypothetical protein
MIPVAVFRPIVDAWLAEFDTPEDAYQLLATNGAIAADSWRKRFTDLTYVSRTGADRPLGWWSKDELDERDVDEFLTAAELTHLWWATLADYTDAAADTETAHEHDTTCAQCGRVIDWTTGEDLAVRVELGQTVNVRRTWTWWTLCAPCYAVGSPRVRKPDCTGKTGGRIPDDELLELYRAYCHDKTGLNALVERSRIVQRHGYPTASAAAMSIAGSWRSWGWPMYDRNVSKRLNAHARRAAGHVGHRIPGADLRKLHVLHMKGEKLSALELARRTYERYGYKTATSAHRGILDGWRALGLKARDRIEMTVAMTTTNGLSPRDTQERYRRRREAGLTLRGKQFKPNCLGTLKRGGRCTRYAMPSGYCWTHDPARAGEVAAHLEMMRSRSPMHDPARLEPYEPIRNELRQAYEHLGTWKPIETASGIAAGRLSQMAGDRKRQRIDRGKAHALRAAIAAATAPQEQV